MRGPWSKLAVCVGCAALLTCMRAHGQEPPATPIAEEPVRVIHADLQTAEQVEAPAAQAQQLWGKADWWLAWIKAAHFPILITDGGTADPLPGALGQPGTIEPFGGEPPHERQGARFQVGEWLDAEQRFGVELGGMLLASRSIVYGQSSPGTPALARPFFNVDTQQADASIVTFPAVASGSIGVQSGTRLYGADANLQMALNDSRDYPLRVLVGLRYVNLHDDLNVQENDQISGGPVFLGQNIGVQDNFACDNYFWGANLGLCASYNFWRVEFQLTAQCALGLNQEYTTIAGVTHIDDSTGSQTIPAGLLAVSSNSGSHVHDAFAVIPEVDADAHFEVTRHLFVSAGYSFLYWSRVVRAAEQVDTNVNPNLVPTSNTYGLPTTLHQPQDLGRTSDFWVQGVHVGLELRF
jgi:hypothetical protein